MVIQLRELKNKLFNSALRIRRHVAWPGWRNSRGVTSRINNAPSDSAERPGVRRRVADGAHTRVETGPEPCGASTRSTGGRAKDKGVVFDVFFFSGRPEGEKGMGEGGLAQNVPRGNSSWEGRGR